MKGGGEVDRAVGVGNHLGLHQHGLPSSENTGPNHLGLHRHAGPYDSTPRWSPDGKQLAFVRSAWSQTSNFGTPAAAAATTPLTAAPVSAVPGPRLPVAGEAAATLMVISTAELPPTVRPNPRGHTAPQHSAESLCSAALPSAHCPRAHCPRAHCPRHCCRSVLRHPPLHHHRYIAMQPLTVPLPRTAFGRRGPEVAVKTHFPPG